MRRTRLLLAFLCLGMCSCSSKKPAGVQPPPIRPIESTSTKPSILAPGPQGTTQPVSSNGSGSATTPRPGVTPNDASPPAVAVSPTAVPPSPPAPSPPAPTPVAPPSTAPASVAPDPVQSSPPSTSPTRVPQPAAVPTAAAIARANEVLFAFVDDATIAAARIEPGRIDLDAAEQWMSGLIARAGLPAADRTALERTVADALAAARQWNEEFRKAGGRMLFRVAVFRLGTSQPPMFTIVPLSDGADADALARLARTPFGFQTDSDAAPGAWRNADAVFSGDAKLVRRLSRMQPVARPDLEAALAAGGNAPIVVAIVPTEGLRGGLILRSPTLPAELGGGPTAPVVRALQWATLSADAPPAVRARLVVQATDEAGARKLRSVYDAAIASGRESIAMEAARHDQLAAILAPRQEGNRLLLELSASNLDELSTLLGPPMAAARETARRAASEANLRQLALAIQMYALDHEGRLPEHVPADLKPYLQPDAAGQPACWSNPRTGKPEGYVYHKPAARMDAVPERASTIMLRESFDTFGTGILVAYANGQVAWVSDRAKIGD